MKRVVHIGLASLLLIGLMSTPVVACLLPGAQLTAAEEECCLQMAGQCHQAPGSDSCCEPVSSPEKAFLDAKRDSPIPPLVAVGLTIEPAARLAEFTGLRFTRELIHGPPDAPPATLFALRI